MFESRVLPDLQLHLFFAGWSIDYGCLMKFSIAQWMCGRSRIAWWLIGVVQKHAEGENHHSRLHLEFGGCNISGQSGMIAHKCSLWKWTKTTSRKFGWDQLEWPCPWHERIYNVLESFFWVKTLCQVYVWIIVSFSLPIWENWIIQ